MSRRGASDYYEHGDWNARCGFCWKKLKGSQLVRQWQGFWVCPSCWEPRQPQDFVRTILERPTPPFVQNPGDIFIYSCTPNGRSSVSDHAVAGCWIAGYIDPAFDPAVIEIPGD